MIIKMSPYNCPGYRPANVQNHGPAPVVVLDDDESRNTNIPNWNREHTEPDLKITGESVLEEWIDISQLNVQLVDTPLIRRNSEPQATIQNIGQPTTHKDNTGVNSVKDKSVDGRNKKRLLTDNQKTHVKKRVKDSHWADVEVKEEKEEDNKIQTGKYKCDQCSYATDWSSNLNKHKIVRHKAEEDIVWYKCPKCPKKLKVKEQLQKHIQNVHDETTKYTCAHCPFKTKLKSSLTSHEITRHAPSESIKWFYCTQCNYYKGRTKELLQQHIKRKHGEFFYRCDHCPYKTKGKDALRTHEITEHEGCIKWSKCDQCGDKFKDEARLRSHKRTHETDEFNERMGIADDLRGYSCSVCEFKTLDRVEFAKHNHQDSTNE